MAARKSTAKKTAKKTSSKSKKKAAEARTRMKTKARHEETLKSLEPVAQEINIRIEKAAKLEADRDDHVLAASLQLAAAKKTCEKAGIKFNKWSSVNVKQLAWNTIRQYAALGSSGEAKARKALEDRRAGNRQAVKKAAAKAKPSASAGTTRTTPQTPQQRAIEAFDAMPKDDAQALLHAQASNHGMSMVSSGDARALKGKSDPLEQVKLIWERAGGPAKLAIAAWVNEQVGEVDAGNGNGKASTADMTADELTEIPASMRRGKGNSSKKKGGRRKAA